MTARGVVAALASALLIISTGRGTSGVTLDAMQETRFWTGCDPGPVGLPPWPENVQTHVPDPGPTRRATLKVALDSASAHAPILGTGFNFEHALWTCPGFHDVFARDILEPFNPAIGRVDTGLLPAAPPDLSAGELGPDVYEAVLSSPQYADSWAFMKQLENSDVRIVLGVWGGPAQFTDDGTRRGTLEPSHYDDYVTYVATVVDFIQRQGISIWATTIANEPDGGDGNQIPPDGLAYIAHQLAPRLAPLGVRLYGPDTANADEAMQYLPLLLDDPTIESSMAFVGFHEYDANTDVRTVVDYVHSHDPQLPVVVTEYTSFGYGDLDAGQEADDRVGFTLDVVNTLLSHYDNGVDAAVYWDAVDYLQPGHDAITRWGLLRGPAQQFAPRTRYFGLLQVLPYLRPGTRVLTSTQDDVEGLSTLAVQTAQGRPAIFIVNQGSDPVDLDVQLNGRSAGELDVLRTDRGHKAESLGRVAVQNGAVELVMPPRSLTTLADTS